MTLDLKIVGGTIVDGTGREPMRADVGIKDGKIVAIGAVAESATKTIDASGAIVTPGFVDVHTHYDGQASWDSDLLPSTAHGVTTAIMGNCGVGFAPCRPTDRERLINLFEGVEDIPGAALAEGIAWNWESFPEYLAAVDARPHAIDVAAYITHDALRIFVMGDRALAGEPATQADIEQMAALARDAIEKGAIGFSTGRTDNHRAMDGSATPASEASEAELEAIAREIGKAGKGVLQAVSDFDMERGAEYFDREFDVIERFAAASGGRPLAISLMQRDLIPTQWEQIIARVEKANEKGITIRMQTAPRGIGVLLGLSATFHPFIGYPSYKKIAHLPVEERARIMADPAYRAQMLSEKSEAVSGDGSPIPPLVDRLLSMIDLVSMRMFPLGEIPNYEPKPGDSMMARAMAKGQKPIEALYDALLEQNGYALLYFPIYNYSGMSLDAVETMLHHPFSMPALADGGAHVGTICDASIPTYFLMHWVRDREKGRFALEDAVAKLTSVPAKFMGLSDRGTIEVGKKADLNVIDLEKLSLRRPHLVHDLPAGGRRFLQDAVGYVATIASGCVIAESGKLTGERPGRVVRPS